MNMATAIGTMARRIQQLETRVTQIELFLQQQGITIDPKLLQSLTLPAMIPHTAPNPPLPQQACPTSARVDQSVADAGQSIVASSGAQSPSIRSIEDADDEDRIDDDDELIQRCLEQIN